MLQVYARKAHICSLSNFCNLRGRWPECCLSLLKIPARGINTEREADWAPSPYGHTLATAERDMYRAAFHPESNEISMS